MSVSNKTEVRRRYSSVKLCNHNVFELIGEHRCSCLGLAERDSTISRYV